VEEVHKCDIAKLAQLANEKVVAGADARLEILEYDSGSDAIQMHVASRRKIWEALLDSVRQFPPWDSSQRLEACIKLEFTALLTDKIQDCQPGLARGQPQTSSQLLQKHSGALRRAEEEHSIDLRNVHALIEYVDREDRI
jgi:hypothetical protein